MSDKEHVGGGLEVTEWDDVPAGDLEALFGADPNDDPDELFALFGAYKLAKKQALTAGHAELPRTVGLDFLDDFIHEGRTLRWQQKLFVAEFLIDLRSTRAAAAAGYTSGAAHRSLLKQPQVRAAIAQAMERRMQRLRVSQDRVVEELAKLAFTNITDVVRFGSQGIQLKDQDDIPIDKQAAIKEINETRGPNGTTTKVVMHDKKGALVDLGKHLGIFKDRLQIEDTTTAATAMTRARERVINAKRIK